ncbi:cyclic nucleotide-binding domain-containing protein [Roseobacteraceae bacterium S113]
MAVSISLVGTIRDIARTNTTLQRLILDFRNVKGIDGAGLEAFRKLEFALTDSDLEIVIADASKETTIAFAHAKLGTPDDHLTILDAPIDAALEHAEDAMLEASGLQADAMDARRALIAFGTSFADVDALIARMEPVSCDAGETLIRAGDAGQDIYLIDSGRLAVFTSLQGMSLMRVRALLPGTFVGEISGYLSKARTADVVAETDSLVYRIGPEFVSSLESEAPHLAVHWHRMMAATLAERVDRTNRLLSELKL